MIGILMGAFAWIKMAALAVFEFAVKYPWQMGCIALACVALWFWNGKGNEREAKEAALAQIAQIVKASEEAGKRALAAKEATEAKYREQANEADTEHKAQLADARDATTAYINSHRVPKAASCSPGGITSPASGGRASVSQAMPADIIVGEADVRACGDLYTYSVSAHDWAKGFAQ